MNGTSNTVEEPRSPKGDESESPDPASDEVRWDDDVWEDTSWVEEGNEKRRWWNIGKRIIAFIFAISLLYVYGIHQGLLFTRTPEGAGEQLQHEPLSVVEDKEVITLPVTVFVLENKDAGSRRDEESIRRLVGAASEIWDQARIDLEIRNIRFIPLSEKEIITFFDNPSSSIGNIPEAKSGQVNIFLTRTLKGINGVAFRGLESVAVADYVSSFDFRVLAHEVGHILGLTHVTKETQLMSQGSTGDALSTKEVLDARERARQFLR